MGKLLVLFTFLCAFAASGAPEDNYFGTVGVPGPKGLSEAHRTKKGAVASLATIDGTYHISIDHKDFLYRMIDLGKKKQASAPMHAVLADIFGKIEVVVDPQIRKSTWRLPAQKGLGHMFQPMIDHGHVLAAEISFRAAKGEINRAKQPGESNCSAYRVADDIYFTAFHCIADEWECRRTAVRLNEEVQQDKRGRLHPKPLETYYCQSILVADQVQDFTAFRINGVPDKTKYPAVKISLAAPSPAEEVTFIGHPGRGNGPVSKRKTYSFGKIDMAVKDHTNTPENPIYYLDMNKLFADDHLVGIDPKKTSFTQKAVIVEGACLPGMSGCPAFNSKGEAYGTTSSIGNLGIIHGKTLEELAMEQVRKGQSKKLEEHNLGGGQKAELHQVEIELPMNASLVGSLKEIYRKYGKKLESAGVEFIQ